MSLICPFIPSFDRYALHFRNTREISRIKFSSSVDFPSPFRPIIPTTSPGSTSNDTSFERPRLFRRRITVESLERRLHRIDNGIAEREIVFLQSTYGVFLAGLRTRMAMVLPVIMGISFVVRLWFPYR